MEQKTLLAIILSIMVLLVWNAMTPRPKPVDVGVESSQPYAAEGVTSESQKSGEIATTKSSRAAPPLTKSAVSTPAGEELSSLKSKRIHLTFSNIGGKIKEIYIADYEWPLVVSDFLSVPAQQANSFGVTHASDRRIVYGLEQSGLRIRKEYEVADDDYVVTMTLDVANTSNVPQNVDLSIQAFALEMSSLDNKPDSRDKILYEYSVSTPEKIHRKDNAYKFNKKEAKELNSGLNWIGFRDRYFCALVKPLYDSLGAKINVIDDEAMNIQVASNLVQVAPGEQISLKYMVYAGPQKINRLKQYKADFEKIVIFSRFGLINGISNLIYNTLNFLHRFIPNWGICIILVSLLVYGSTYPLTIKGMSSMKKMQSLQPLMTELKEKHKNNPQKLNTEMMDLYKKNKVNPASGCFLLILQMPVFFGLYQVLWRSVSLKGADFLWIQDLSQPDKFFKLPFHLPFNGGEYFNLLPILMGILMFAQQKITAKNMVTTDPAQQAQQKMMGLFLPFFMCIIFYKFASGLALYFTMFYLLSIFTQIKMSKITHTQVA